MTRSIEAADAAVRASIAEAEKEAGAIKTSAGDLVADYHPNEVAADRKYKGRYVHVTGTVAEIGVDAVQRPLLRLRGWGEGRVICASGAAGRRLAVGRRGRPGSGRGEWPFPLFLVRAPSRRTGRACPC